MDFVNGLMDTGFGWLEAFGKRLVGGFWNNKSARGFSVNIVFGFEYSGYLWMDIKNRLDQRLLFVYFLSFVLFALFVIERIWKLVFIDPVVFKLMVSVNERG